MCSILGTPDEISFPGIRELPDYKPTFPHWNRQDLRATVRGLNDAGIDLLDVRQPQVYTLRTLY